MLDSSVSRQRLIGMLAVVHSIIVLVLWFVAVRIGLSGRVWLAIGWLWLIWPVLLAILPGRSLRLFLVPVIISLLVLAACIPALLAMTAWAIGGFAP
jgi:hypothetical protein